ncbi:glycosyltransferase family 2 protein [Lichenihabitans psoromatis]|uniref:glycosyltransferase family 2 protein n=1 Tax=Lichenihabitans psoromatis TaxID=2528642 RepID=UPI001036DCFB|nr:glycosyltransferase family 2 protein [Lichenihabitans psoromatis]
MIAGHSRQNHSEPCPAPLLSVIVPTFNERDNVPILFDRLAVVLRDILWEMIVVDDDSTDGTWDWARRKGATDARLRCLRRVGRRGLAGACLEGALCSSAPVIAVIDGDLQHDETILAAMWRLVADREADLVIGTRRDPGGVDGAMSALRRRLSGVGATLSRIVLKRAVADPMSGFFMVRRDLIETIAPSLVSDGFKILLDVLLHIPCDVRVAEVVYDFRERGEGDSKLDARVLVDYVGLIVHRLSGDLVPIRMTAYVLVGLAGLLAHILLLRAMIHVTPKLGFHAMETLASFGAMPVNFLLNNALTFRERRVRGWSMVPALVLFGAVCSVGVLANLSVATWIFADAPRWWLAGFLGALVSAFWNYAVSAVVVWPLKRARVMPYAVATEAWEDDAPGPAAVRHSP